VKKNEILGMIVNLLTNNRRILIVITADHYLCNGDYKLCIIKIYLEEY